MDKSCISLAQLCRQIENAHIQAKPVNPTPVRDEASKRGDDFYDAEPHMYSVVNVKHKKRAKKTSEDGEGEREEQSGVPMAVSGESSLGVMNEALSQCNQSDS